MSRPLPLRLPPLAVLCRLALCLLLLGCAKPKPAATAAKPAPASITAPTPAGPRSTAAESDEALERAAEALVEDAPAGPPRRLKFGPKGVHLVAFRMDKDGTDALLAVALNTQTPREKRLPLLALQIPPKDQVSEVLGV